MADRIVEFEYRGMEVKTYLYSTVNGKDAWFWDAYISNGKHYSFFLATNHKKINDIIKDVKNNIDDYISDFLGATSSSEGCPMAFNCSVMSGCENAFFL